MSRKTPKLVVVLVLAAAGCTSLPANPDTTVTVGVSPETTTTIAPATTTTTTTRPARDCPPGLSVREESRTWIESLDPMTASISISQTVFSCADEVVVTSGSDLGRVAVGAQLAAGLGGPLLVAGDRDLAALGAELYRLAPRRVTLVGALSGVVVPAGTEVEVLGGSVEEAAEQIHEMIEADIRVEIDAAGIEAVARVLRPTSTGESFWVPASGSAEACDRDGEAFQAAIDRAAAAADAGGGLWLVDACSPEAALAAAAAARPTGATVLLVDGRDLRSNRAVVSALPGSPLPEHVVLVGKMTPNADWQVDSLLSDQELPGGGLTLFPGRRIVALYGNPTTPALGVLGEQGPGRAVERAREVAEPYGADGAEILPAFEIIATVASASATADGDYSFEMSVEELLPWVEIAGREGLYVTLDLQPGRTDFLTQAKRYEELLLLPHVGLALDPEWRLESDQVHLRQIGSVDAIEVNQVVEWLAELVRENHLPQKLLILHQFKFTMITNREMIETPPELAVLVHADGQGPIHSKYDTYAALTGAPDADRWWWGWKNFYDEDSPTPTPEQVLELDPLPVYVSHQ
ncbi:MAG: hypothetical protein RI637_03195 [Acidimicrobiia bacterium]|nr:hypothetical protein [Acidimicrobiia bacterium]